MAMHPNVRDVTFAVISGLLVAGASLLAAWTVHSLGHHAHYGEVASSHYFLGYYLCVGAAFSVAAYALLGARHRSRFCFSIGIAGLFPELIYSTLISAQKSEQLSHPISFALSLWNLPGALLYRSLTGVAFDRWATGLTSPPTRVLMLDLSTAACLNFLGWFGLALVTSAVYVRLKR